MSPKTNQEVFAKMLRQIGASIFFGVSSVLIITVNKTVLTTYRSVVLINAHCMRCRCMVAGQPCTIIAATKPTSLDWQGRIKKYSLGVGRGGGGGGGGSTYSFAYGVIKGHLILGGPLITRTPLWIHPWTGKIIRQCVCVCMWSLLIVSQSICR